MYVLTKEEFVWIIHDQRVSKPDEEDVYHH